MRIFDLKIMISVQYTFSKNDIILSVRKHYCVVGLVQVKLVFEQV